MDANFPIHGRDEFIQTLWQTLSRKSIYMNDLRRIGKTKIIEKMHAERPIGWLSSFSDLEGTHSAEEFATLVYKESSAVLDRKKQELRRIKDLLKKMGGLEIAGIVKLKDGKSTTWKELLRLIFDDIDEALTALGPDQRMVFFWDEVPYFLDNVGKREGMSVAMEVLDLLRELSQRHDRIRLVLTGSIGIHHLLNSLWAEGYKGSPLNHMDLVQPGPLEPRHAAPLAAERLTNRGVLCADMDQCAAALSEMVGHVPFYIDKLVNRLPRGESTTPALIEASLVRELQSDTSDWDLDYYRRRVRTAYREQERLVLLVLDAIAAAETHALAFAGVRQLIAARMAVDDETLREVLRLLCMDHYLTRTPENEYRFYLRVVRHWWKLNRSL